MKTESELTAEDKLRALEKAVYATGDKELSEQLLDRLGERHGDGEESPQWWAITFEKYALHGRLEDDTWSVVHADDGAEVTAELSNLPLESALRRMDYYTE